MHQVKQLNKAGGLKRVNMLVSELSQLKGIFCLDHYCKIYVPSTINVDNKTTQAADLQEYFVNACRDLFSRIFGGATSNAAIGAWSAANGEIVTESIVQVTGFCSSEQLAGGLSDVLNLTKRICKEMQQEAVTLEVDNKIYFIC